MHGHEEVEVDSEGINILEQPESVPANIHFQTPTPSRRIIQLFKLSNFSMLFQTPSAVTKYTHHSLLAPCVGKDSSRRKHACYAGESTVWVCKRVCVRACEAFVHPILMLQTFPENIITQMQLELESDEYNSSERFNCYSFDLGGC